MDKMLKLKKNIEFEVFYRLLDLCFEVSTFFSFTENGVAEYAELLEYKNFLKELEPFLVESIKVTHWHHYYVPDYNKKNIYIYNADKKAKRIIKNNFNNLFLEDKINEIITSIKALPEDLCFFYDNKLILGTVSHEGICSVYPHTDEIYKAFLQLGEWEIVDYSDEEQIILDI